MGLLAYGAFDFMCFWPVELLTFGDFIGALIFGAFGLRGFLFSGLLAGRLLLELSDWGSFGLRGVYPRFFLPFAAFDLWGFFTLGAFDFRGI